jgi:predicted transcriptional regulator
MAPVRREGAIFSHFMGGDAGMRFFCGISGHGLPGNEAREYLPPGKRSPESMVSEAIAQYVAREEDQVSFMEEAEASWKSYQETGLHLNSQETHACLGNWGTEGDEAARC